MKSTYLILFRGFLTNPQSTLKSLQQASLHSIYLFHFSLGCICIFILPCRLGAESFEKYPRHNVSGCICCDSIFRLALFRPCYSCNSQDTECTKKYSENLQGNFPRCNTSGCNLMGSPDWRIIMYMGTYPYQPWYCWIPWNFPWNHSICYYPLSLYRYPNVWDGIFFPSPSDCLRYPLTEHVKTKLSGQNWMNEYARNDCSQISFVFLWSTWKLYRNQTLSQSNSLLFLVPSTEISVKVLFWEKWCTRIYG